jgi:hypothetical protein
MQTSNVVHTSLQERALYSEIQLLCMPQGRRLLQDAIGLLLRPVWWPAVAAPAAQGTAAYVAKSKPSRSF